MEGEDQADVISVAGMQFDDLSKIRVLDPEKHEVGYLILQGFLSFVCIIRVISCSSHQWIIYVCVDIMLIIKLLKCNSKLKHSVKNVGLFLRVSGHCIGWLLYLDFYSI